jgi:Domain of unknown function (4846)
MRVIPWILFFVISFSSIQFLRNRKTGNETATNSHISSNQNFTVAQLRPLSYPADSWPYFLQHLPEVDKPIVDYKGNLISNQEKHYAILTYDIGHSDLQQCADALMRIRAEYLFSQKKYALIGFHFNSGNYYSWKDYLSGMRPVLKGGRLHFTVVASPSEINYGSLRKYLDIVFAYANTVSLCRELKNTDRLETGTVIIYPGNPGHCCMIVDEALREKADTVFKLLEGYMPAQSIYILSNPYEPDLNPWYHLGKGDISTASCIFRTYYLRKFE